MSYIALLSVALGLGAGTLQAQEKWAFKLFTEEITHDFGTAPRGPQLVHHFKMKNIFQVPLEISLHAPCHCLTATASPSLLQPGQVGSIDVVMNTLKFEGSKKAEIDVVVGPKFVDAVTLKVHAVCQVDVVLNPGQIDFGVVHAGNPPAPKSLDAEYTGAGNWRILEVLTNTVPVNAAFAPVPPKTGKVAYRISVSLNPEASAGPLDGRIFLKTNDPAAPLLPIPVEANIQAQLAVTPKILDYGKKIKMGKWQPEKLIMVKAGKPFRVVAIDGLEDGIAADIPATEARVHVIKVTYRPTKEGPVHKQLTIKTDLDKEQVILTLEVPS